MTLLIPMRSRSKRLTDKNIIDFFGRPIYTYPLQMAINSGLFERIIIACDKEYYEECEWWMSHADIYIRDKQNSRDESPLIDLVREVVEQYNIKTSDEMCILYSTSVLTTKEHLERGFERLNKGDVDCVFPIIKQDDDLLYYGEIVGHNPMTANGNAKHADAFFIFKPDKILKNGNIIQWVNGYIELKDYEAQPVHNLHDFEDLVYKWRARNK